MATIDITCTVPAPTLAQVRAWLTREGWYVVDPGRDTIHVRSSRDEAEHVAKFCDGAMVEEHEVQP